MKTSMLQLLGIILLTVQARQLPADTYYNPVGPIDGPAAAVSGQFLGARFTISSPTMLSSVGGEFQNMTGSFFVALVPLASMTSLPAGNPAAGIPFNPEEVLAYQIFEADVGSTPEIITTPFSINLTPGVYGVVFGSGLYGATGYPGTNGGMPEHATVAGSSSFFWSERPMAMAEQQFDSRRGVRCHDNDGSRTIGRGFDDPRSFRIDAAPPPRSGSP